MRSIICCGFLFIGTLLIHRASLAQSDVTPSPTSPEVASEEPKTPHNLNKFFREERKAKSGVEGTSDPVLGNSVPPYSYKPHSWTEDAKDAWEWVKDGVGGWFSKSNQKEEK